MNHKLYQIINSYLCQNEQEQKDKEAMLNIITLFDDVTTRENTLVHFTASPWIVNQTHTKTLMVYHRIFDSWSWCGGHLDGSDDPLAVALSEGKEETGLAALTLLTKEPIAIDLLPVHGHRKNNKYVPSHLHCNLTYLCEADDRAPLYIKEDENSGVSWFAFDEIEQAVSEKAMLPVYKKLIKATLRTVGIDDNSDSQNINN